MNSDQSSPDKNPNAGFFKLFFTSCLGTIFGLGLLVGGIFLVGLQMTKPSQPKLKPNTVLKLTFNKPIPELTGNTADSYTDFQAAMSENIGLNDISKLIDLAINDNNIKGIYLDLSSVPNGWATTKVLRNKLIDFKKAGKFVIAYSNGYDQRSYYLASVANSVYLHPEGGFSFMGFSAQMMYFKGLMDKLGVTAQIFYAGKFKSATEPFRRSDMTPENRAQVTEYMRGMYDLYLEELSKSRNLSYSELFNLADNGLIRSPADAVKYKLVDKLKYNDEVLDELRKKLGTAENDNIEVTTIEKYLAVKKNELQALSNKDKIAIVYAEGGIVDGQGDQGSIGGDKYASIIRKIRKDDRVKAIVMRVNSGGGSALASDIIWRELEMAKKQGIHIVTSMGDVAASGGYYIAANSEVIFAEDNTITGSIGVFGMVPNMRGLFETHMGITVDTVKIGKYSMMSSAGLFFEFSEEEGKVIQESVDQVYTVFKKRVSDGRKMSMEAVDEVAQGRVWLGKKAIEIGLVDKLGGLEDAIASAAKLANLADNNYTLVDYPKAISLEEKIMMMLGNEDSGKEKAELLQQLKGSFVPSELNEYLNLVKKIQQIKEMKGVQMRLPYEIQIN